MYNLFLGLFLGHILGYIGCINYINI